MEEFKGFIYSVIPLGITITIMITTWNGSFSDFGNSENRNQNQIELYRISDYQNYEPTISGGMLYWKDGGYYNGEFSDKLTEKPHKKRNGFGAMHYPDGCVLTGEWVDGIIEGKGTYDCNEGIYSGEFKNNKINGLGILNNKDGSYYSGEWLNEEPNGYGVLKYQDGAIYEGYWVKGIKEGTGKYTSAAGNIYEGNFSGGLKNGKGKVIYTDGTIQEGIWENDVYKE